MVAPDSAPFFDYVHWEARVLPVDPGLSNTTRSGATMDEKKLQALVRKNAAKAEKTLKKSRGTFDSTLDVTRPPENPNEDETMAIFREMKKREF